MNKEDHKSAKIILRGEQQEESLTTSQGVFDHRQPTLEACKIPTRAFCSVLAQVGEITKENNHITAIASLTKTALPRSCSKGGREHAAPEYRAAL